MPHPPEIVSISASLTNLAPGQTATISVVAEDPDGDNLSYSYTAFGGNVDGNSNTAIFTAGSIPGAANVTVNVSDGQGGFTSKSVSLSIARPVPSITISAIEVPMTGGGTCLLFRGQPSEAVLLDNVTIQPPGGFNPITYSFGSTLIQANQPLELQDPGACYLKASGTWTFTFNGRRQDGSSFVVTSSHNQP